GNISGAASVKNTQVGGATLHGEALTEFIHQVRTALPVLPDGLGSELTNVLDQIEQETRNPKQSPSKIRELLRSVRTIAEGAAGNLAAAGIIQALARTFGV